MKSLEIRTRFFNFFKERGHTVVPSSSLIPADDPTLLFANAGMNQFKDVFLGKETRSYKRAVSIQKCIRAGGKHNDLENVGFTERHLTFFEMMGNFSFGDYFKKDAIIFAWDFLTKEMGLPTKNLYATVYKDDQEAYDIWHKTIGLAPDRISKLGAQDNFWQMGDIGPCGPCTEIYIDRGVQHGCGTKNCAPGCSCDRFLEIWNNVFMQFDRSQDAKGNYHDKPLKQTGVDTGMGLERLALVMQNAESVFETDLFMPIITRIQELTGHKYTENAQTKAAFRVLADHIRSSSFAIADGCTPSNEGRGYVLRKIIRRAALFAQKLGPATLFPELSRTVVATMGAIYPELRERQELIYSLLMSEIEKFSHNLVNGQSILQKYFEEHKNNKIITGAEAFKLYDTYGFPLELTKIIAQQHGYQVNIIEFEEEMEKQRLQSGKKVHHEEKVELSESTRFTGYDTLENITTITKILCDSTFVEKVPAQEICWIITPESPFYVECGGQINDTGWVITAHDKVPVLDIKKINNAIAHKIKPTEPLKVGDTITLVVDKDTRLNTMKNHTATHLLQAALMDVLGKQVKQSGSLVAPDYLRFDFSCHESVTPEMVQKIENLVNKKIMENIPVTTTITTYKNALDRGVIAFFGEKYNPDNVRVVEVAGFSAELCGGTHVSRTGDIGCFKITELTALSAGNKRIVAVTGPQAVALFQETFVTVKNLSQEFKVKLSDVAQAISKQRDQLKALQADLKKAKKELIKKSLPDWSHDAILINSVPVKYIEVDPMLSDELRDIAQLILQKLPGFICIVTHDKPASMLIQIPQELTSKINLKSLAEWLKTHNINAGGSQTMIQGKGVIDASFKEKLFNWIKLQK